MAKEMAPFAKAIGHGGAYATRLANWAVEEGKLKEHHCYKLKKFYQSNRTEIIWTSGGIAQFNTHEAKWV